MPERARTLLRRWAMVAWATVAAVCLVGTAAGAAAGARSEARNLARGRIRAARRRPVDRLARARAAGDAGRARPSWSRRARPSRGAHEPAPAES